MLRLRLWLRHSVLISIDQSLNVLFWLIPMPGGYRLGSGDADETLSRYWGRIDVWWAKGLCKILHVLDNGHCGDAVRADDEGHNTPEKMAARYAQGLSPILYLKRKQNDFTREG